MWVDMSHAGLVAADLTNADFVGANFQEARLRGVDFSNAQLNGVKLAGADLRGANLKTSVGLLQGQVDQACLDETTKLPPELKIGSVCNVETDDSFPECGLFPLVLGGREPEVPQPYDAAGGEVESR